MPDLVPIPYQPTLYLTPRALARLLRACAIAGHNIILNGYDAAWRPKAWQQKLWDAYQAYLHGGPYAEIASNPNTGQRNHMRGEAADILNRADRGAMLAAGFTPDADEWWHFNDPDWPTMPIIETNTSSAAIAAAPITEGWEEEMDKAWEYFRIKGDASGSIFVSWNRCGYWGMSAQTFADHQWWLANVKKVPVPRVVEVINAQAFGPKLG